MTSPIPSPEQVARDPLLFARTLIRIRDKKDRVVPLHYNAIQRRYLQERTPRDLILKPRQIGFSTAIQSEFRRYEWTRRCQTLIIDKDHINTAKNRRRAQFAYDQLPEGFRPKRDIANATVTTYPDIGSEATIVNAGNRSAGRGDTYTYMHGSEVAFWPDAQAIVRGALEAGSPRWVVLESTPNGAQGWFYEECLKALNGESAFRLHFYTWWDHAEYTLPCDSHTFSPTDEETALMQAHGLTPGQIVWRRAAQLRLGDEFRQEYPEDPITCFLTSGASVFTLSHESFAAPMEPVVPVEGKRRPRYVMGVDWGQAEDYTAWSVFAVEEGREVVIERMRQQSWQTMLSAIVDTARRWGVDMIFAEKNSMGSPNIETLYNLLAERGLACGVQPYTMTQVKKANLVGNFKRSLETQELTLLDVPYATHEMRAYTSRQTANGLWSYSHPDGGHDDTVDARLLAWYGVAQGSGM